MWNWSWLNNNQRKVFVWQKVEIAETVEAKVAAAAKAEAVEDKETAAVGQAARPASPPVAADRMLRPVENKLLVLIANNSPQLIR